MKEDITLNNSHPAHQISNRIFSIVKNSQMKKRTIKLPEAKLSPDQQQPQSVISRTKWWPVSVPNTFVKSTPKRTGTLKHAFPSFLTSATTMSFQDPSIDEEMVDTCHLLRTTRYASISNANASWSGATTGSNALYKHSNPPRPSHRYTHIIICCCNLSLDSLLTANEDPAIRTKALTDWSLWGMAINDQTPSIPFNTCFTSKATTRFVNQQ